MEQENLVQDFIDNIPLHLKKGEVCLFLNKEMLKEMHPKTYETRWAISKKNRTTFLGVHGGVKCSRVMSFREKCE